MLELVIGNLEFGSAIFISRYPILIGIHIKCATGNYGTPGSKRKGAANGSISFRLYNYSARGGGHGAGKCTKIGGVKCRIVCLRYSIGSSCFKIIDTQVYGFAGAIVAGYLYIIPKRYIAECSRVGSPRHAIYFCKYPPWYHRIRCRR